MPRNYALEHTPPNTILRKEYAQDDDWIRKFLSEAEVGYVATRWDDQPFITPVNFWYDRDQHELYFHTNLTGRLQANSDRHPKVCFAASQYGKVLPSNVALEFGQQYESVVAFGRIRLLEVDAEKRRALYGLIARYFPQMEPGVHYRPITEQEISRTAVYAISIESWSGKRNWHEQADQSDDWSPLPQEWLD